MTERTALYRLYDTNDVLLYVGITDNLGVRWNHHAKHKTWWPDVARHTADWYASREEVAEAEVKAIETETPLYNIQGAKVPPTPPPPGSPAAWWHYVKRVAGEDSPSDIARRVGIGPSSVGRWQISSPKVDNVRAFATAYDRPVLEAFIAAGILSEEEAGATQLPADLSEVDLGDLLAEALRRVQT